MPHFILSSVDGHLGCFCVLAIVNNDTTNIGVNVAFWISPVFFFFPYIYPTVELLDRMVVLFLVFWATSVFSKWGHQFTLPSTVYKGSLFSTSSPIFVICTLFFFFLRSHLQYMDFLGLGIESAVAASLHHNHSNTQIQTTSVTHTAAFGNVGSLTHQVRPGIETASLQTLCQFLNQLNHNSYSYLYTF